MNYSEFKKDIESDEYKPLRTGCTINCVLKQQDFSKEMFESTSLILFEICTTNSWKYAIKRENYSF